MCSQHCGAGEGPASGEKGLIQPLQRAPTWRPPIRTSFPPMASNIFSSWTRSCWMLFIRMQGWSGGMETGVSTNKCGWNSCPLPQFPPTLHWGTQEQPWYRAPAWQHFGDCHQTETESRTCIMGTSSGAGATVCGQSCPAAPGRCQAEGRYVTTFSFSLEQYEAKSLEMISAYWSSTLLMVWSQTRAATKTPRQ